jgi:hypothetical protein
MRDDYPSVTAAEAYAVLEWLGEAGALNAFAREYYDGDPDHWVPPVRPDAGVEEKNWMASVAIARLDVEALFSPARSCPDGGIEVEPPQQWYDVPQFVRDFERRARRDEAAHGHAG